MADPDKDDKTEAPTQKKLDDARDKGQLPQSREVATLFLFAVGVAVVSPMGAGLWRGLLQPMEALLARPHSFSTDPAGLTDLLLGLTQAVLLVVAVPLLGFALAGILAYVGQNGLLLTLEPITPKFSKLSPVAGLKRVFGPKALMEALKSVLKIGVAVVAIWYALLPLLPDLVGAGTQSLAAFLAVLTQGSMRVVGVATVVALFIAVIDVIYQRYTHNEQLKMSRQQIKDEHKESDGDPQIKQRIRQIRADRARQQLAAEVPKATVVITNPTHFAIALRYDQGEGSAPKVVAKGVEAMALQIRKIAREHSVPIIENPPLARALHREVEIGHTIPEHHFQAVAQVIGFVLSQRAG